MTPGCSGLLCFTVPITQWFSKGGKEPQNKQAESTLDHNNTRQNTDLKANEVRQIRMRPLLAGHLHIQ